MFKAQDLKLRPKLTVLFLMMATAPLALAGWMAWQWSKTNAVEVSRGHLQSVREIKKKRVKAFFSLQRKEITLFSQVVALHVTQVKGHLETARDLQREKTVQFFENLFKNISILAANPGLAKDLVAIDWVFRQSGNRTKGEKWTNLANRITPWLAEHQSQLGLEEIYLISRKGNVVLATAGGVELGKNLKQPPMDKTPLGNTFANAQEQMVFQDFQPYPTEAGKLSAFIGLPVNKNKRPIGSVVFRLSSDALLHIQPKSPHGSGNWGTYLVGPGLLPRSDPLPSPKARTLSTSFAEPEKNRLQSPAVKAALAGKRGSGLIIGRNDRPVVAAWAPISIKGHRWAIVAEADAAEIFRTKQPGKKGPLFFQTYLVHKVAELRNARQFPGFLVNLAYLTTYCYKQFQQDFCLENLQSF